MNFRFPPLALAALAAAALPLAACNRSQDDGPVTLDGLNTGQEEQAYSGPMPTDPQGWSTMLSTGDLYQIEAGKLAQSMSRSKQVQAYGALMQRYHTQSASDLEAAAAQVEGVSYRPQLSPKQQADLGKLRNAGANFDALYKKQMVAAQQEALWLLQGFAANGSSAPLKVYAGRNAPVIENHLARAYDLPGPN